MSLSAHVSNLLGTMTLEEKVGQVFVFTIVNEVQAQNDLALHPGGFIRIYSDALTVALVHPEELWPSVPVEPHDVRVKAVLAGDMVVRIA